MQAKDFTDSLADLLDGLRNRGLSVGIDDSVYVAKVFAYSEGWDHERQIRALKSLLARTEEERQVIEQLSPLLFVGEQKVIAEDEFVELVEVTEEVSVLASDDREGNGAEVSIEKESGEKFDGLFDFDGKSDESSESMGYGKQLDESFDEDNLDDLSEFVGYGEQINEFSQSVDSGDPVDVFSEPTGYGEKVYELSKSTGSRSYQLEYPLDRQLETLTPDRVREAAFHLSAPSVAAQAPWLNIEKTIDETVRKAGQLTLKYGKWCELRSLLFIEDISLSMARWPCHGSQFFNALVRQGTNAVQYYMNGNPAILYSDRNQEIPSTLEQVMACLSDSVVVIFSDCASFNYCKSLPWQGTLVHATWFHPRPVELWDRGARYLSELFRVVPMSDEGLSRFGNPRLMESERLPRRWRPSLRTGNNPKSLVSSWRGVLGEQAFRWLAAGAILDQLGCLTARLWWALRAEEVAPAPWHMLERVWDIPGLVVGIEGNIRLPHELRIGLVDMLESENPNLVLRVMEWAGELTKKDLDNLDKGSIAELSARTCYARIRSYEGLDEINKLVDEGWGAWIDGEATQSEKNRWQLKSELDSDWCRIEPGTFLMGSPNFEDGRLDWEGPQHEVTIRHGFLLKVTPVTQGEWFELMRTEPWRFKEAGSDAPVERVSWYDAVYYCNALSRRAGLEECYEFEGVSGKAGIGLEIARVNFKGFKCSGYRLPTEAEWEYAARAGSTGARYGSDLDEIAWYAKNSGDTTHLVGQKAANAWGLYDMLGNVYEWCWDLFGDYSVESQRDPTGKMEGSVYRVVRGGSFSNGASYCRSASRRYFGPGDRFFNLGFRVVLIS